MKVSALEEADGFNGWNKAETRGKPFEMVTKVRSETTPIPVQLAFAASKGVFLRASILLPDLQRPKDTTDPESHERALVRGTFFCVFFWFEGGKGSPF